MILFRFIAAAASGAVILAATPASAAVKVAKYTGIVTKGADVTGVFTTAGTDLTGYSWTATFTYDKTLGGYQYTDAHTDQSIGGAYLGYPGASPMISATLTINGVGRTIAGSYGANIYTSENSEVGHYAEDYLSDSSTYYRNYFFVYDYPAGAPASLDQNFGPVSSSSGYGYAQFYTIDNISGTDTEYAYAYFGPEMAYSVGSAVPEPANWALVIAGFGLVGAAMRRRAIVAA